MILNLYDSNNMVRTDHSSHVTELHCTPQIREGWQNQGQVQGMESYRQRFLVLFAPNMNYCDIWAVAKDFYYVYIFKYYF